MADRTHLEDIDLPARNQADPARSLFISYASHDAAVAEKVCSAMEAAGFPCWMAPRDVKPGAQYADAIVAAINAAKALVLVLSASAVASAHVGREVERAASKHKPMIAFRIDNAALSRALEYFLSESQWIDVSAMGMPAALARLAEAVGQGSATPAQALSVGERPVGAMTKRTRLIVVGVAVFVVGVLVALTLQYWRSNHAHTQASPAAAILNRSIAVLPFVDLSEGKNQSYFSDGLSEEVIGRLTQIPQLRVIARTSSFAFAGSPASAADIGRQLNVTNLLEGSVRRSADRVRVSAQLVRVSDSTNLWSATYERKLTDVLAMQDEIANAVVAALQVNLDHGGQSLVAARYVPKPDAYDEYLRGRQLMRLRPDQYAERAVEAFSKAVSLDHQYAAARSMLAFALSWVAENVPDPAARRPLMERALAAAEQAVALGPSEPDVFSTRGYLRFEVRRDLAGAEADFQKAMQLDPNGVPTLTKYSDFLAKMGRSEEALALTHRIKSTDPFFPPPWEIESQIQAGLGDYKSAEDSVRHARSILQLDPDAGLELLVLALLKGEPQRAKRLASTVHDPANRAWGLALAEHDLGDAAGARKALAEFVATSPYEYYQLAAAYARERNSDAAFAALERAYRTRDPAMDNILIDPLLGSLRDDARYEAMLTRLGFPTAPRRHGPASQQLGGTYEQ